MLPRTWITGGEIEAVRYDSTDGQDFPLRTSVANKHHGHFTGLLIHPRFDPPVQQ